MSTPTRSTFVTVVGWLFAIFSGFGLFISVLQNIMVHTVFPMDLMTSDVPADFPPMARFMFDHLVLVVLLPLVVAALLLAGSVGLIKRREWARKFMVGLMAVSALWSVGSVFIQVAWMGQMPSPPPGVADGFATMQVLMVIFAAVWGLGFAALFAWIAKRLMSWDIKQEFRAM